MLKMVPGGHSDLKPRWPAVDTNPKRTSFLWMRNLFGFVRLIFIPLSLN